MWVKVWHFSPIRGLQVLLPKIPNHPDYADHKGVYLALSLDLCKFWADAMAKEGYWHPPFYFYRGMVELKDLRQIKSVDDNCEKFILIPIVAADLENLDQVISIREVFVEAIEG